MSHPFTSTLLEAIGKELGIAVVLEPEFRQAGVITSRSGARSYFKLSTLDCNKSGSAKIAADKEYASYFMKTIGYPVPEGKAFFSEAWCAINKTTNGSAAALDYADSIGFPVIVKPNSKAQGIGVTKVHTRAALATALESLFTIDSIVLVQRVVRGEDYRLIVYKDTVPIAYERKPLSVTGDGTNSVRSLLAHKLELFKAQGRNVHMTENDPRVGERLQSAYSLSLDAIPPQGQWLQLLDNANMSSGGEARDISTTLHASYKEFAMRLTRDMGLTLCGVDLMTTGDLEQPMHEATVIEINDRPGLEHYSSLSAAAFARTKELYKRIVSDIAASA